jgi:signal transduction histidine kinase
MADNENWTLLIAPAGEAEATAIRRALAEAFPGVAVEEERDPARVPARLKERWFDCLLVDQTLPGAAGVELVRRLCAGGAIMPQLALIEHADPVLELELYEAGAADVVLLAELTPSRLARRVRAAIRLARAEPRLAAALEDAQRALEARDEILAIVSHDLRNPLNAIQVAADELESTDLDAEARRRLLGAVRRSLRRADRLIDDLLDASRLEAGGLSLELSPVLVRALLEQARRDHELLAREVGMDIEVAVADGVDRVRADRERMLQALGNFIANALHHAEGAGPVTLGAELDGEMVCLTVVDRGPGIPPEELPHVFDRYWQARRQRRAGAGLGLAIARGIVLAHGGTIAVSSVEGQGTRFRVRLPRA